MFTNLSRIFKTTFQDLGRNKYISLSSIAVMTLVFLVFTIFILGAFGVSKFLQYVETREHLEVFFNPEVEEQEIISFKNNLEGTGKTTYVKYTSQSEAAEYLRQKHSDNPLILGAISPEKLPASLAVRAKEIEYVTELNNYLLNLDENNDLIYKISYNEDTTNVLKDLLTWVRAIGGVLFAILIIVIFLVSLISVEIGIYLRKEEISIMQLVGGGKFYIRMPFILQGMIIGSIGASLAFIIILFFGIAFYFFKDQSPTLVFLSKFFGDIDWPQITYIKILIAFFVQATLGSLVGGTNSIIAVLRHFK